MEGILGLLPKNSSRTLKIAKSLDRYSRTAIDCYTSEEYRVDWLIWLILRADWSIP